MTEQDQRDLQNVRHGHLPSWLRVFGVVLFLLGLILGLTNPFQAYLGWAAFLAWFGPPLIGAALAVAFFAWARLLIRLDMLLWLQLSEQERERYMPDPDRG